MPLLYDDRRRRVITPQPAAQAARRPTPLHRRDAHPVQPQHVSAATAPPASSSPARIAPTATRASHTETLPHAIERMLEQGYSRQQVEGQVRRWHPGWSPAQVRSEMNVAKNPVAHTTKNDRLPRTAPTTRTPKHASTNCTPLVHRQHHGGILATVERGGDWTLHHGTRAVESTYHGGEHYVEKHKVRVGITLLVIGTAVATGGASIEIAAAVEAAAWS